jgi:hypothetical protein
MEINPATVDPGQGIQFVAFPGEGPRMNRDGRVIGIVDLEDEIFPLAYL